MLNSYKSDSDIALMVVSYQVRLPAQGYSLLIHHKVCFDTLKMVFFRVRALFA